MHTGIGCVQLISRFFGVAADPKQLHRQFVKPGEPASSMDVVRMIKSLGLKSRQVKCSFEKILKSPLPAIAEDRNGDFFIMAKAKADEQGRFESVLIQRPGKEPEVVDQVWLDNNWNQQLILTTKRASLLSSEEKFGFKWFIPALLKYKRLNRH